MESQQQAAPFEPKEYLLIEFESIREEIKQHQETQFQIISLTLIVAGTVVSLGLQPGINPTVLLVYPILSMFLAINLGRENRTIMLLATYIRSCYETHLNGMGWETFLASTKPKRRFYISSLALSNRGIFIGTQVLSVLISLIRVHLDALTIAFYGIDAISVAVTFFSLRSWRKPQTLKK